jgi:hypothetical protein
LGDWRGEWIGEVIPISPEQQRKYADNLAFSSFLCTSLPTAILVLGVAIILFFLFAPYKLRSLFKKTQSPNSKTSKSVLQRTGGSTKSEITGTGRSLVEYLVTYTAEDKLFDLSFEIEKSPHYLGECGITVSKVLDIKSSQATALEMWLFSARSNQTVSKVLMSDFCYSQEALRSMINQGQAQLIQPGEIITLGTKELIVKAKILQIEYESNTPNPKSIFKKVVIKIGVWANTGQIS